MSYILFHDFQPNIIAFLSKHHSFRCLNSFNFTVCHFIVLTLLLNGYLMSIYNFIRSKILLHKESILTSVSTIILTSRYHFYIQTLTILYRETQSLFKSLRLYLLECFDYYIYESVLYLHSNTHKLYIGEIGP